MIVDAEISILILRAIIYIETARGVYRGSATPKRKGIFWWNFARFKVEVIALATGVADRVVLVVRGDRVARLCASVGARQRRRSTEGEWTHRMS